MEAAEAIGAVATVAILIAAFAYWMWYWRRTAGFGKARQQLPDEAEAMPQEKGRCAATATGQPTGHRRFDRRTRCRQVGDGPSPPTRMSRQDMFAAGFYGGLGFLAATAVVWVALIAVAVALVLALAGDNR